MIRVRKSDVVPEKLRTDGATETAELVSTYASGTSEFTFKRSIYAHPSVWRQLQEDQNSKCCFCEAISIESMDVEHFRPKGRVTDSKEHPGYYWLAYDWENLLGCCNTCNSRAKNNLFPLVDPTKRATNHTQPLAEEEPLFVHPVHDEPTQHIAFDRFTAYGLTDKGRATVEANGLALNRKELLQKRKTLWARINGELTTLYRLREAELDGCPLPDHLKRGVKDIEDRLKQGCLSTGEFSAMVNTEVKKLYALVEKRYTHPE